MTIGDRAARSGIVALVGSAAAVAAFALPVATAQAKSSHCGSVKMNQFYKPAANGLFGALGIVATGTGCSTARTVAGKYVRNPYSVGNKPKAKKVNRFSCNWKPNNRISQRVNVTCTRTGARITFGYEIPNG